MTVVPLYCAKFIRIADEEVHDGSQTPSFFRRFEIRFNQAFHRMLDYYEVQVTRALQRPGPPPPS